jgi:hypothetical protein
MINRKEYMKEYRKKHRKEINKSMRDYYQKNKEKYKKYAQKNKEQQKIWKKQWDKKNEKAIKEYKEKYNKKYYQKNKEEILERNKQYRQKNKDKLKVISKEYFKKYQQKNKKRIALKHKEWRQNNPEHKKLWERNKRKTDLKHNLNCRMAIAIGISLKGNKAGRKWETLVGYTVNDLKKHLEKTLPIGYSWNDVLSGELHIDHIIPKSVFNFDDYKQIDFQRCWALDNLQLLPARENFLKRDKLSKPFQPSLKI